MTKRDPGTAQCRTSQAPARSRRILIAMLALAAAIFILALCGCAQSEKKAGSSPSRTTQLEASDIGAESSDSAPVAQPAAGTPISDELLHELTAIADSSAMNVAISFTDLENPADSCSVAGARGQRSASVIKLLILNELLSQASAGQLSLDEGYTLGADDIVGGTGVLQGRGAGASTTFREMAQLMISASDNVATNVIIDRLGMDAINDRAADLGLGGTRLNRRMMDTAAIAAGIENYISSDDANRLLQMIYDGSFVDAESSRFALEALEAQTDGNGILGGLPGTVAFAHKTGTLSNAQNDSGIALGEHPYALTVLCEADPSTGSFSASEAYGIMARCAQAVTNVLGA